MHSIKDYGVLCDLTLHPDIVGLIPNDQLGCDPSLLKEGDKISIKTGTEAASFKFVGSTQKENYPSEGTLLHRGWKTESIKLPERFMKEEKSLNILAPAEIELN